MGFAKAFKGGVKRLSLPSVVQVAAALGDILRRFPWAFLMAALGTGAAISLVELAHTRDAAQWQATGVLLTAVLGLPLTIAAELLAEALGLSPGRRRLVEFGSLLLVALYYVSLPASWEHAPESVYLRTLILALGLHFVVAFTPVAGRAGEAEFWDFNWRLFLRFWLGALYSAVLFLGLVAAVASASQLFDLRIRGERYFELWLMVVGLFNTCFVLRGMPRVAGRSAEAGTYPRGLSVFAQFALAPLVVVYLAILYPYAAKILVNRAWPNGWVSLPILCLAVAGILAALFLHPLRDRSEERWAAWYWRWFFRVFLPLTVLLFLAVRVRVNAYGVTESRYFGFVLAVWLAGVSACYASPARRSIRWLPASLALLCLLTVWGPWGAFQVSERSQFARLERTLTAHQLLAGGVLTPRPVTLEHKEFEDLKSMLRYLRARHDSARLDRLLASSHAAVNASRASGRTNGLRQAWVESENVLTWLQVEQEHRTATNFTVRIQDAPEEIGGYSRAAVVVNLSRWANGTDLPHDGWPRFELDRSTGELMSETSSGRAACPAVGAALDRELRQPGRLMNDASLSWKQATVPVTIDGREYVLVILQAAGDRTGTDRLRLNSLSLLVLAR